MTKFIIITMVTMRINSYINVQINITKNFEYTIYANKTKFAAKANDSFIKIFFLVKKRCLLSINSFKYLRHRYMIPK